MTYAAAYKRLNAAKIIDKIISEETANGANLLTVKKDIIDSINYYVDFTKATNTTFTGMKYWQETRFIKTDAEKQHHRICNAINKALAEIEIAEMSKKSEQLQYMIRVQR